MRSPVAKENGVEVKETRGEIIAEFFEEFVEDTLIQPTYYHTTILLKSHHLLKERTTTDHLTYRFEAFANGSGKSEMPSQSLNDAEDQRERFEKQVEKRSKGDHEAQMMDY
jgi:lysyl-tRNA synthetase class 2